MMLGVGIDIVDNARMKTALERNPLVINKILSQHEQHELDITDIDFSTLHNDDRFVESLAARFAAKEATVKSLGMSLFAAGLHSIEVHRDANTGAPHIVFPDAQHFYTELHSDFSGTISFHCSLTHSAMSAAAVVIAHTELSIS